MGVLIDTSVLVEVERSGSATGSPVPAFDRLGGESAFLAAITASELQHGVHRADSAVRRARRQAFVETLLDLLPVLPFDLTAARLHAALWAELRRGGRMIGAHDLLIAATALAGDLTLLTRNRREFGRIEGLRVEGC